MTLTQLNYILAVDRTRNFAQAAKSCFVTQPTLSMQIQKLEDYLQIIVFDRSKSPVEPTPMGVKVLEYARRVIQNSQALEELSKSLRGEVSGEFLLAVIPTLAPYLLPLFVQQFVREFPKVELKIFEHQTDEIIKLLKEGKLDGAILATPLEEKTLTEEHLFHEPFSIFLSSTNPNVSKKSLEEKDLSSKDAWLLKEGHCLRAQALQLCQLRNGDEHKHLFFEAGSLETLINMVKASDGFTVLPYLATMTLSEADKKNLRSFKGVVPAREIAFVTGPMAMKKSIESAIVKVILKNVPKELKKTPAKLEVVSIH